MWPEAAWDMNTKDPGHCIKHRGNTIGPRKVEIQRETYWEMISVLFAAGNLAGSHVVHFFPPFLWGRPFKGIFRFLWCAPFSPVTFDHFRNHVDCITLSCQMFRVYWQKWPKREMVWKQDRAWNSVCQHAPSLGKEKEITPAEGKNIVHNRLFPI